MTVDSQGAGDSQGQRQATAQGDYLADRREVIRHRDAAPADDLQEQHDRVSLAERFQRRDVVRVNDLWHPSLRRDQDRARRISRYTR